MSLNITMENLQISMSKLKERYPDDWLLISKSRPHIPQQNISLPCDDIWFMYTLDHLTYRALYFSRIALELYFRAFYIWQERTTRKIEDNSCLRFVSLRIQTPWFVIFWLHFDFSDCLLLANSLIRGVIPVMMLMMWGFAASRCAVLTFLRLRSGR